MLCGFWRDRLLKAVVHGILLVSNIDARTFHDNCLEEEKVGLSETRKRTMQGVTLRFKQPGYQVGNLILEVARILLRERLMYDVEDVMNATWAPKEEYENIAKGNIDAGFDLWSMWTNEGYDEWVKNGDAYDAGPHEFFNTRSGIAIPRYVLPRKKSKHLPFYTELMGEKVQQTYGHGMIVSKGEPSGDMSGWCQHPNWNCSNYIWRPSYCSATSCKAQLLKGVQEWDIGVVEQLIANHNLNISVVYMSDQRVEHLVQHMYSHRLPFIFYNWLPRESIHGIPQSEFEFLNFPMCDSIDQVKSTNHGNPTGALRCQHNQHSIKKVISPKMHDEEDAKYFAESFTLTENDLNYLLKLRLQTGSEDAPDRAAACIWLKREGERKWGPWIQYTKLTTLGDFEHEWKICASLLIAAIVLIILYEIVHIYAGCKRHSAPKRSLEFLNHKRSFHNWKKSQFHHGVEAPSPAKAPFRRYNLVTERNQGNYNFLAYLSRDYGLYKAAAKALIVALISGVVGTFIHILKEKADMNKEANPKDMNILNHIGAGLINLYTSLSFCPIMFLSWDVHRTITYWMSYVNMLWNLRAKLEDFALVCIAAMPVQNTSWTEIERRELLYRFYRYLNILHYLTYFNLDKRICGTAAEIITNLRDVGLLSEQEAHELDVPPEKMLGLVLSWMALLWKPDINTPIFMQKLTQLREASNVYQESPPNMTCAVQSINLHLLLFFMVVAFPFQLYDPSLGGIQVVAMSSVLGASFVFYAMLELIKSLGHKPFGTRIDDVNVDYILCSTELVLFGNMRSSFRDDVAESDENISIL